MLPMYKISLVKKSLVTTPSLFMWILYSFLEAFLPPDANHLAGKNLSQSELDNLFIYGRECHITNDRTSVIWLTYADVIDFRAVSKVSTTKVTGDSPYYAVTLYFDAGSFSNVYKKV